MGTPDVRFYAVNDRPVAMVPTWDGGTDCVAFDFATGELLPDRSYFSYLMPGSGKDVDVLTRPEFEARLAVYRAQAAAQAVVELRRWAVRLCMTTAAAADLAAALGPFTRDQGEGASRAAAVLDAEFHAARELPIPPDSWLQGYVRYQDVTAPGVPARCGIDAQFQEAAAQIRLSREPG